MTATATIPTPRRVEHVSRPVQRMSSSSTFWWALGLIVLVIAIYLPLALNGVPSTDKFPTHSCSPTSNKAIQCRGTAGTVCCTAPLTHDMGDPVHCSFDAKQCFMPMLGDGAMFAYYTMMVICIALMIFAFFGTRILCLGSLFHPEPRIVRPAVSPTSVTTSATASSTSLEEPLMQDEMKEQSVVVEIA